MKMSSYSIGLLYRQLAVLYATGIRADEAFNTLAEESDDKKVKRVCSSIKKDLEAGVLLSDCLKKYPKIFNPVLVNILKKENRSEKVSKALTMMADVAESSSDITTRVFKALFFPATTFIIAIFAFTIILLFVVPVFGEMFAGFGSQLPAPTQFVVNMSKLVRENGLIIIVLLILVFVLFIYKKTRYSIVSKIPVISSFLNKSSTILFTKHLSVMLFFGASLKEAIESSANALSNVVHAQRLRQMGENISDAKQLREGMLATRIFPKVLPKMVDAGAKSDSLTIVFEEISKFYEKDFDRSLHKTMSLLEVFAVIFVGTFVGGIVISMYLPIFQMGSLV